MTADRRNLGKSVDRLLLRLPKPSPEQVHSSQERVGRVLRSQKNDASADEPADGDHGGIVATRHRWFAFAAASALVIAVIGSAVFIGNVVRYATGSNAIAHVVDGTLYRNGDSKSGIVGSGQRIAAGELLQSGEHAGTVIALADGSHIEMRSASEISLDYVADGVRIHLGRGSVIVTAAEQHHGHLYVQTRDVTVAYPRRSSSNAGTDTEEATAGRAGNDGTVHAMDASSGGDFLESSQNNPRGAATVRSQNVRQ
jgi:hypothetical protein